MPSKVEKTTGYLPGTASSSNGTKVSPYTIPYTGSNAIPTENGYLPASMSNGSSPLRYPGFTPSNTPEPQSGSPTKFNRDIGNLTKDEIAMRIASFDAQILKTYRHTNDHDKPDKTTQDKLRSCRRDWELVKNHCERGVAAENSCNVHGDVTAFIEAKKRVSADDRLKLIIALLEKEKNVLPRPIYVSLQPKIE